MHPPDLTLTAFARALAAAGVPTGPHRRTAFVTAVSEVGIHERDGVYWAGRATLCGDPEHVPVYDRVFDAWFSGRLATGGRTSEPARRVVAMAPLGGSASDGDHTEDESEDDTEPELVRAMASASDVLRHRDVAELSVSERAELARLFDGLKVCLPRRPVARRRPSRRGDVDARRTLREELRRAGEPGPVRYRRRTTRARRVVLLVDVSGSMGAYADALLRLAHVLVRRGAASGSGRVEVFTVGTRLTRVTEALRARDGEAALEAAGAQVPDWSGGTRLGEVLHAFIERWGRRGTARGAVLVVFSDGWERGDAQQLAAQVAQLQRLAHRVIWVNPHRGKEGYLPVQAGIVAVLPHVDALVAGHSMHTFEELAQEIGRS